MVSWRVQSVINAFLHLVALEDDTLPETNIFTPKNWMVGMGSFPFGARRVIFSGARNVFFRGGSIFCEVPSPESKGQRNHFELPC